MNGLLALCTVAGLACVWIGGLGFGIKIGEENCDKAYQDRLERSCNVQKTFAGEWVLPCPQSSEHARAVDQNR